MPAAADWTLSGDPRSASAYDTELGGQPCGGGLPAHHDETHVR
ncbi:hypothetical protein [Actinoallomurus iriomotensis]|nr:hypothetical protein [Actinoallomurus iriomotensis]